ncbi:MAG TPA: hypothetical protein DCL41_07530 [Bdellovibrionales bacterium]|nr:hypothetical protein [Bdellovibrionales bacterium]
MRLLLNSERAQTRIISEVQKKFPEWEVKADRVQLHLASGIWPGVTVELGRFQGSRKVKCGEPELHIDVDSLKIPVSLWSLLVQNSKTGLISMDRVDIEVAEKNCDREAVVESGQSLAGPSKSSKVPSTKSSSQLVPDSTALPEQLGLRSIYNEIRQRVSGLKIEEVSIFLSKDHNWSLKISQLHLNVEDPITLGGDLSIWSRWERGELRQDFSFALSLMGPLLEWNLETGVKEGKVSWTGQMDEEAKTFLQQLKVHQGPMSDLLSVLYRVGLLDVLPEMKRVWLNCELTQGGGFKRQLDFRTLPVRIDKCRIDGEVGNISVEPQLVYFNEPHLKSGPIAVKFKNLSLDLLFENFALPKMDVIFARLGNWSGQVQVTSLKEVSFSGILNGMKVNVSHQSLQGIETIEQIEARGSWRDPQLKVNLSHFSLTGGEADGEAQLSYDKQKNEGDFLVDFKRLSFSAPIQRLLFQKGAKPLQIHLEAGLKDGKVDHLKGKFGSEEIYGQGWSVKNIESKISQKKQEEFQFDLKASAFEWGEGFRYQDLIANQRKQLELKDEVQSLKDLSARVVLDTEGGRIERFRGKWLKVPLQFEGGWVRGEHLEGQFRRTKPSKTSELILQ